MDYNDIYNIIQNYKIPTELHTMNWVAVANGGLFIAQCLAFRFNKRLGFCDPKTMKHTLEQNDVLLIDDVIFTGNTLHNCKEIYTDSKILCLVYDATNNIVPDYYMLYTDEIIYFPWESKNENEFYQS